MNAHFKTYYWDQGSPQGLTKVASPCEYLITYKIVKDPYGKRISLEKYSYGKLSKIIYDSSFLDFRKLNPKEQLAWQKEMIRETENEIEILIRNIDDRVILIEKHKFENRVERECQIFSPHGVHLSTHRIFYKKLGDSFDGTAFYDVEGSPVMIKSYALDEKGEFGDLIQETWCFRDVSALI